MGGRNLHLEAFIMLLLYSNNDNIKNINNKQKNINKSETMGLQNYKPCLKFHIVVRHELLFHRVRSKFNR